MRLSAMAEMSTAAATAAPSAAPMRLLRLVLAFNLHPQASLHPSWLPPAWPAPQRAAVRTLKPAAQDVLGEVLRQRGVLPIATDFDFDARPKRLLLLDAPSLRRLAFYASLCAHAPLLRVRRSRLAALMRRQAARFDADAVDFVLERAPQPSALRMSAHPLEEHPWGCGRVLMDRGYRLLQGVLAAEGERAVQRLQRKLPRRASALPVPALSTHQADQLRELMLSCIVPERLPAWDWLF
jgi:type III secretion protein K